MDTWVLWFLLLQSVVQYPQRVGDGLDEVTHLRMEASAKLQEEEKIRLELEVEQLALKQDVWAWGDLLCSALQLWQLWAGAGLLLLLLALCYGCRKRSSRRAEHQEANDGANGEIRNVDANEEGAVNEEVDVGNEGEEGEDNGVNGEENNNDAGNAQEVDNVAANEEGDVGNEVGNEVAIAANNNDVGNEVNFHDHADNIGRIVIQRIQWPVQDLQRGCDWTNLLMENYAFYFQRVLSDSFYPVLKRAIGVGSAFEGWSPREQDVVYQVLVPMTPPRGHSFHLELESAGQMHVRNFRIRVQQECTCGTGRRGKNRLCFLHHPKEELRSKQDPSLVDTLCTDSYLDVHKTARWFYQLVRAIWPALPQSHNWHLMPLPSRRSCQFKVTKGTESFHIEILFGVRQGDSDVFVSSQPREAYTSRTVWPETYAVAEMKFFKYIARRAPRDSLHLKCLQFFIRLQLGLGFSTYATKTIFMHLLSIIPAHEWRRRHFVRRLLDISESLRTCVQARCLSHFIVGNRRLPLEIRLPPDVLMASPCNLFHDLEMDPVAHSQAMSQYVDLHRWLKRILNNEQ
ncbi:PREDICTED: inositol 1,4,5-trisphosphate receptor-interacting protein-like 1 [Sturnus vulgaris]|uniref:inositol 1,4,5-trisphosphate receptor-interacting protein-like 1 n=1 Tax=Sturnus vulgaris TaxID=9172 RepID=UPI00071AACC8|nr:PREDICTED: inositol 1,4,5-trisphosphate receptor-interacting protein-like 1 [Sturnus vulgaris]